MGGKSLASTLLVVSFLLFAVGFGVLFSSESLITGAAVGLVVEEGDLYSDGLVDNETFFNESSIKEVGSEEEIDLLGEEYIAHENSNQEIASIEEGDDVSGATASCQDVSSSITLSGNIVASGTCFDIVADNLEINGNGFTLIGDGTGNAVIINDSRSNITIHNFSNVSNFSATLFNFRYVQENLTLNNVIGEGPIIFWYSAGGHFYDINLSNGGGVGLLDTNDTLIEDNNFSSVMGLGNALDVIGTSRNITSRNNHFWNVSGSTYRISSTTTNSLFENDLMTEINVGVQSQGTANTFRNLEIVSPTGRAFFDQSDNVDTLEYNNSYGLVRWNQTRTTVNSPGELRDGTPILIQEENITYYPNPDPGIYSQLEDNMEIAFYGLTYDSVQLIRNDVRCDDDPVFCNVSYYGGVLYANVSAPANFTVNGTSTVDTVPAVPLLSLNATDVESNFSFDDFHCYVLGLDNESSNLTAELEIYNSSSLYYSVNQTVDNNTLTSVYSLDNSTVYPDENWTCGINLVDESDGESGWINSTVQIQSCGVLSKSYTFSHDIIADSSCYSLGDVGIEINLNGYTVYGSGVGDAFYGAGQGYSSDTVFTLHSGTIDNFSSGINFSSSSTFNISNLTISNSTNGIYFVDINLSNVSEISFLNNGVGINLSDSYYNLIQNNLFQSTINAISEHENLWNTTYSCVDGYENIIGGNCTGGNYWSDYPGIDNGNGSAYPWNISQDKVGDQEYPWNSSANITVSGDFLPLVYACPESWTCGSWSTCSSSSQSRTCTDANACGTTASRPALTQACVSSSSSSSGGGGGSSSSTTTTTESTTTTTPSSSTESTSTSTDSSSTTTAESTTTTTSTTTSSIDSTSTDSSDDGGVEIPPPSEDVYSTVGEITGVLTVDKAVVTESTPSLFVESPKL